MIYLTKPYNVLILDDEADICSVIKQTFVKTYKRDDFNICTCTNPHDALALMDKEIFHILITDIKMPEMNGDEVIRQVVAKQKGTQIVVLTGDCSYSTVINSYIDGAMSFISKPIVETRFKEAIDICLYRLNFWKESVEEKIK